MPNAAGNTGTQVGNLLAGDGAEGGGQAAGGAAGSAGAAGGGGAGTGSNTGSGGGQGTGTVVIPENWKQVLPPELRDSPALTALNSIEALAKSFVHAQSMVGADKAVVPKSGDEAALRAFLGKAGLPEKYEEYKPEVAKEFADKMDPEFLESFRKVSHEVGVLPGQAKKIAEWFSDANTKAEKKSIEDANSATLKGLAGLKSEWGDAYQDNLTKARAFVKHASGGDEKIANHIRDRFGADPIALKVLVAASAILSEDAILGDGGSLGGAMTPGAAKARIEEISSNIKGPYYDKNHPEHIKVKNEMTQLYTWANPPKKRA